MAYKGMEIDANNSAMTLAASSKGRKKCSRAAAVSCKPIRK